MILIPSTTCRALRILFVLALVIHVLVQEFLMRRLTRFRKTPSPRFLYVSGYDFHSESYVRAGQPLLSKLKLWTRCGVVCLICLIVYIIVYCSD